MNVELFDTFGQHFPEEADGSVDCGSMALCCTFNRWGSLLAVGCNDGRVAVIDFLTRATARTISAHVQPVCGLSWSRDGHILLTASTDNTVALWEVVTGQCIKRFNFPLPVLNVQFHPRDNNLFLVCPMRHPPVIVNANTQKHNLLPLDDDGVSESSVVACYSRRGDLILSGNSKGRVTVYSTSDFKRKAQFRLPSNHPIKNIYSAKKGDYILLNSADRIIRVYELDDILQCNKNAIPEPSQKLQDMVNKTPWKTCCLSGDGQYVCAASAKAHSMYIWEKNSGSLVKILHGSSKGELLLDVQWHPSRPLIASVSCGVVGIWAQSHVENWSAFAPDFKELDENVEYDERESEFDMADEDKSVQMDSEKDCEDMEVDVVTIKPPPAFCSSDEDDDEQWSRSPLLYLPIAPEIEQPEENIHSSFLMSESNQVTPTSVVDVNLKPVVQTCDANQVHPMIAAQVTKKRSSSSTSLSSKRDHKKKASK